MTPDDAGGHVLPSGIRATRARHESVPTWVACADKSGILRTIHSMFCLTSNVINCNCCASHTKNQCPADHSTHVYGTPVSHLGHHTSLKTNVGTLFICAFTWSMRSTPANFGSMLQIATHRATCPRLLQYETPASFVQIDYKVSCLNASRP